MRCGLFVGFVVESVLKPSQNQRFNTDRAIESLELTSSHLRAEEKIFCGWTRVLKDILPRWDRDADGQFVTREELDSLDVAT